MEASTVWALWRSAVAGAGIGNVWARGRKSGPLLIGTRWATLSIGRATTEGCTGRADTEILTGREASTAWALGRSSVAGAGIGNVWARVRRAGLVLFGTRWATLGIGRATAEACTGRAATEGLVAGREASTVWAPGRAVTVGFVVGQGAAAGAGPVWAWGRGTASLLGNGQTGAAAGRAGAVWARNRAVAEIPNADRAVGMRAIPTLVGSREITAAFEAARVAVCCCSARGRAAGTMFWWLGRRMTAEALSPGPRMGLLSACGMRANRDLTGDLARADAACGMHSMTPTEAATGFATCTTWAMPGRIVWLFAAGSPSVSCFKFLEARSALKLLLIGVGLLRSSSMLMTIPLASAPSPRILFLLFLHLLTRETPELITDHIPLSLSKRFLLA